MLFSMTSNVKGDWIRISSDLKFSQLAPSFFAPMSRGVCRVPFAESKEKGIRSLPMY